MSSMQEDIQFQQGPVRARVLNDLSAEEKERYKADIRATNILLHGIPKDIYSLINHYTDPKDIGENVKDESGSVRMPQFSIIQHNHPKTPQPHKRTSPADNFQPGLRSSQQKTASSNARTKLCFKDGKVWFKMSVADPSDNQGRTISEKQYKRKWVYGNVGA
ncbi:hypothetical protein Tco_1018193 [Tanacetum coccineum]|uniref:Uncharacterized protein n=1 Tax=Tanacetum coccineum TaxID=301880 RepID=A0ABQ5FV38_9ASTR